MSVVCLQESRTLETVSGIPVAKLKANDPDATSLSLKKTGCGPAETAILGAILKVVVYYLALHTSHSHQIP